MEEAFEEGQGPHRTVESVMMMMVMMMWLAKKLVLQKAYIY
jgi:hypothetical protein